MHITGDLLVLFGHAFRRVDHHQHHIRPVNGPQAADHTVPFQRRVDFAAPPHAGGIDEDERHAVVFEISIHGIPGRTRNIADHQTFFAEQCIDQRRLADIGTADHGDPDGVRLIGDFDLRRQLFDDGIEQIAQIQGIDRRHGDRLAQAEAIELITVRDSLDGIDFVDGQHDRLLRSPQHADDLLVHLGNADFAVHNEQNDVRFFHGQLGLIAHRRQQGVIFVKIDPAGVHQGKLMPGPLGVGVNPVACHPRRVIDDGHPFFGDSVE